METEQESRQRKGKNIVEPKFIEKTFNFGFSKNSNPRKSHKAPRTQPIYVNPIFDGQQFTKNSDGSLLDSARPLKNESKVNDLGKGSMKTGHVDDVELDHGKEMDIGLGLDLERRACTEEIEVAVPMLNSVCEMKLGSSTEVGRHSGSVVQSEMKRELLEAITLYKQKSISAQVVDVSNSKASTGLDLVKHSTVAFLANIG